jgi:hypothetical protein
MSKRCIVAEINIPAELRSKLRRAVRRPIPDTLLKRLSGFGGPIEEYLAVTLERDQGNKENFRALKRIVMEELEYLDEVDQETKNSPGRGFDINPDTAFLSGEAADDWVFDEYERARARAISEYMAIAADRYPAVTEFRDRTLGGNLLSPEEALNLLNRPESLTEDLRSLGRHLTELYPGWGEGGAMWFVLTGKAPHLEMVKFRGSVTASISSYSPLPRHSVTLTITPWISPKSVEMLYRQLQQRHLAENGRKKKPRTLEVARFYWEQCRLEGKRPPWRVLCERWNDVYPDEQFEDWHNFREYAVRGVTAALPRYRFPS